MQFEEKCVAYSLPTQGHEYFYLHINSVYSRAYIPCIIHVTCP